MTILVCGATGFVGSSITRHLLAAGHSVRALTRSPERAARLYESREEGRQALSEGRLTFAKGDVTKPSTLAAAVEKVDAVVQASQFDGAPVEDPARGLTYERVDRDGTINLLDSIALRFGTAEAPPIPGLSTTLPDDLPRVLYVSGITVSATATEPWNKAKWQAEEAIRNSSLAWTIVRCCWAYGPGDKALNRILGYSDYLPFVPIFGPGKERLTPLYVEDIGRLFSLLLANPGGSHNSLFHLGGPDEVNLGGFLGVALAAMDRRRPILRIPKILGKAGARLVKHLPGRPLTPEAVDFASQGGAVATADHRFLADRFPDFRPTGLREGLETYLGR